MQIKSLSKLLWILPFISFVMGYQLLNMIYTVDKMTTPNLVGKQLTEAIKITSSHNLNLRIISEQIDADLPENTILTQKPVHQNIKPNQAIFVVVSKKPQAQIVPNLCGYTEMEIKEILAKSNLKTKNYYLPNMAPKGYCICQTPAADATLNDHKLLTYISAGSTRWVVMPKLTGLLLTDIKNFLEMHDIKINIKYLSDKYQPANLVIEQKPNVGTIVSLDKLTQVEIYVTTKNLEV